MTAAGGLTVRVWVTDVWDTVELAVSRDSTVGSLKETALAQATGARRDPARSVVKYHGARVADERQTLTQLGARDGAPFIVLPGQRQPVR
jgi:hypothetical protein